MAYLEQQLRRLSEIQILEKHQCSRRLAESSNLAVHQPTDRFQKGRLQGK